MIMQLTSVLKSLKSKSSLPNDAGLKAASMSNTVHAFQYRLEIANTGGWYLQKTVLLHSRYHTAKRETKPKPQNLDYYKHQASFFICFDIKFFQTKLREQVFVRCGCLELKHLLDSGKIFVYLCHLDA